MKQQPLIAISLALMSGIFLAEWLTILPKTALPIAAFMLFGAGLLRKFELAGTALLLAIACLSGHQLSTLQKLTLLDAQISRLPGYARIQVVGCIDSEPRKREQSVSFTLRLHALSADSVWQAARGKLRVLVSAPRDSFNLHQEILAEGNLVWPIRRNPGGFDLPRYLHQQGIQASLRVRNDGWVGKTGEVHEPILPIMKSVHTFQQHVGASLDTLFSEQAASVLRGLLLGDRSDIEEQISDNFVHSGVIHILAVSGLHVGFVIAIGWLFARVLHLPQRHTLVLIFCSIWAYATVTGLKPPVVRASVMASIFLIGRFRDRPIASGNLLACAALLILIVRPQELLNPGFQLSFAAVAGILYFYPKIFATIKKPDFVSHLLAYRFFDWLFRLLAVSTAAQLATLPFSLYHFGTFSFIGIFANLVMIPLVFAVVLTSFGCLLLLPLSPILAQFASTAPEWLLAFAFRMTAVLADLPFASIAHFYPTAWVFLLYIPAVLFIFSNRYQKMRFFAALIFLVMANAKIWFAAISEKPVLKAVYFDIGQGDASLLHLPDGRTILIDAGPALPDFNAGEQIILPYLQRAGIAHLDAVFITHPHLDHFGGLTAIAQSVQISHVFFADTAYSNEYFQQLLEILQTRGVAVHIAERGMVVEQFSPVRIWVAGPHPANAKREKELNQASLVLQVRYGNTALLFTGDTEMEGENHLSAYHGLLKADILQVGHHGSKTSSTPSFLEQVTPKFSVLSLGAFNRFQHPAPEVTARLAGLGSDTLRTDLSGTVIFSTDGKHLVRQR